MFEADRDSNADSSIDALCCMTKSNNCDLNKEHVEWYIDAKHEAGGVCVTKSLLGMPCPLGGTVKIFGRAKPKI
jgi:hypothetical protein